MTKLAPLFGVRASTLFLLGLLLLSMVLIQPVDAKKKKHGKKPHNNIIDNNKEEKKCVLSVKLIKEIKGYKGIVHKIFDAAVNGPYKGKMYKKLAQFTDKYPARIAGSENLENSIDDMVNYMNDLGVPTITEDVDGIPNWKRGAEWVKIVEPIKKNMAMIGVGLSVGTPKEGITAPILVVRNFEELAANAEKAAGKIVVFNQNFNNGPMIETGYVEAVAYRSRGAIEASKLGALAVLVRSVTPFSIYSPHTGALRYEDKVKKIPAAAITVEDAEYLYRLQQENEEDITVTLYMEAKYDGETSSRNVIGTLKGREKPEEIVVISGHIDSWDNGRGAMDDGGGLLASAHTVTLLKSLGLRPRRTIQSILWTTEELGYYGVLSYVKKHKAELNKYVAAMESDNGAFKPNGLDFAGSFQGSCIMKEVVKLFSPLEADRLIHLPRDAVGSDITALAEAANIATFSVASENSRYFWFHHTAADTMTVYNSEDLDKFLAVYAATSYIIADLSVTIPVDKKEKHAKIDLYNKVP